MRHPVPCLSLALLLGTALACPLQAAPLSSAFTYQGELYDSGEPLVGSVDLRFTPYADDSNPTLLGPPVVVEDVLVSDGVFTAKVDFGDGFFVGDQVWLEVAVRPFDSVDPDAFQALNPRQELTASPYTLKPAPGSVTDVELAGDAVGSAQLADNAVASAEIVDASVTTADLDPGVLNGTFWRLGGNSNAGGAVLGTTDNATLSLVSPPGVTINGSRFNSNTELTIRGNPNTVETNADVTLWPRGGEAFFNIAAIPSPSNAVSTPANTSLFITSVGTNPFTGFQSIARFGFDGAFSVLPGGGASLQPRIVAERTSIGFDATDTSEAQELVLEDVDAQLGLYSSNDGGAGSVITLGELDGGDFTNAWGLYRATSVGGNDLRLTFGTNQSAAGNPVLFHFGDNGSLGIGNVPPNGETEMLITPSPANADNGVDLALQPRGGDHLFDLKVEGSNATDTSAALLFAGPSANFEPRLRVTGTGSFGAGKVFNLAHGGSFVFADDSSATPVATTAANQFVVRAAGGLSLVGPTNVTGATRIDGSLSTHATPIQSSYELNLNGSAAGEAVELGMREIGSTSGFTFSVDGTDSASVRFRLQERNNAPPPLFFTHTNRLTIGSDGFLAVSGGTGTPGFPLSVGTNTSNGNGAHINPDGTYSSSSSRTFKEAFSAIDAGAILDRLLSLPIERWRYRGHETVWHIGPVAEDFYATFGLGAEDKYITTVDADGVALAAIQGLAARAQERADALERENATLRAALDALAARVAALERGH